MYEGVKTQNIIEKFTPLVKSAFNDYITDSMNDKISAVLKGENVKANEDTNNQEELNNNGIVTTEEEIEAFYTLKIQKPTSASYTRTIHGNGYADLNSKKMILFLFSQMKIKKRYVIICYR